MKRLSAWGAAVLLLLPNELPTQMQRPLTLGDLQPALKTVKGTIGRDSTLAAELQAELSPARIHRLVESARPTYDLARVSVGHPFGLALRPDGAIAAFSYGIDELQTLRVTRREGQLEAEIQRRSYDTRIETAAGTITSSLFETISASDERDQLALELADIFAWDIDFNTEIQQGDSFRVALEKLYLEGHFARYGRILAAEFVRGERQLLAVFFETEDGKGYYAADGTPLRKAFLRSPLRFSRISSRFSRRRFHPILKTVRPHLGVDYAAPSGTPVRAAGKGRVTLAGWSGGYGKAVKIRHANGFETLYGHLSRIEVRKGQRVVQGARIGTVGKTGLATGPHLDYRMTRNATFVNPLTVQSPPAESLRPDQLQQFLSVSGERLSLLPPLEQTRVASGPDGS